MFRHFAIVTMMLTAAIAMFADGENRELLAAEVRQSPAPAAGGANGTKGADTKHAGSTQFRDGRRQRQVWGPDIEPGMEGNFDNDIVATPASPMAAAGSFGGEGEDPGASPAAPVAAPPAAMAAAAPPGMPGHLLQQMAGTGPAARKAPPRHPTPDEINRMLESSRERSGGGDES
jgi:hypothetical protein